MLSADLLSGDVSDIAQMLAPIVPNVLREKTMIRADLKGPINLSGKSVTDPVITGKLKSNGIYLLGEGFERLAFDFQFREETFNISRISAMKGDGLIKGFANIAPTVQRLGLSVENVEFQDLDIVKKLNLSMTGKMNVNLIGRGNGNDTSLELRSSLSNSKVAGIPVQDSVLLATLSQNILSLNMTGWGEQFILDSEIDLKNCKGQNSFMNLSISLDDIRLPMALFNKKTINATDLGGAISASFKTSFCSRELDKANIDGEIGLLNLNISGDQFFIAKKQIVDIQNGAVKKIGLGISSKQVELNLSGDGSLGKDFFLAAQLNFPFPYLGYLVEPLQNPEGSLKVTGRLGWDSTGFDTHMLLSLKEIGFSIPRVPTIFNHFGGSISYDNGEILVGKVKGNVGSGIFTLDGRIKSSLPYPFVDLQYNLTQSRIALLEKSNIVISGAGGISGSDLPYTVTSKIDIHGSQINDDPSAFKESFGQKSYSSFLPIQNSKNWSDIVLDVDVMTSDAIHILNKNMDMFLLGNISVKGDFKKPRVDGTFDITPDKSKIIFKGNDFKVNHGRIKYSNLDDSQKPLNASLECESKIGDYQVVMNMDGSVDNIDISLRSNPPLSREDVFSLLTLGFTSDISEKMQGVDRESATSVGVGSFLVDQLEINQDLNSALGLKFSVQSTVEESKKSQLTGRTTESADSSAYKSATKLELKRKIGGRWDAAISSTMGGTFKEKREMNLNYNVNENFSLQGIYERYSTEDEQEDRSSDSLGADLKFKWSF